MRIVLWIPMALFFVTIASGNENTGLYQDKNEIEKTNEYKVTNDFEIGRYNNPERRKTDSNKRHKHPKIEVIPADESLQSIEFPEEIEEELGWIGMGKHSTGHRKKRIPKVSKRGVNNANVFSNFINNKIAEAEADAVRMSSELVVTEDSRIDFITEINDGSGKTIDEEIHQHHVIKVSPRKKEYLAKGFSNKDKRNFESKQPEEHSDNNKFSEMNEKKSFGTSNDFIISQAHEAKRILSNKQDDLVKEMILLRDSLNQAIQKFESKETYESNPEHSSLLESVLEKAAKAFSHDNFQQLKTRKKREGLESYRTCIYIDIPGSRPNEKVVPFIIPQQPEEPISGLRFITQQPLLKPEIPETYMKRINEMGKPEIDSQGPDIPTSTEEAYPIYNVEQPEEVYGFPNGNFIYWLRIPPPKESYHKREMFQKLLNVVRSIHRSGKDILFIPVRKGFSDSEEVKRGFLKTLKLNPINVNNLRHFEIKLIY